MKNSIIVAFLAICCSAIAQEKALPIIDIHLHAYESIPPNVPASWAGEAYAREIVSPENAEVHQQLVLEELKKHNIKLALVSSESLTAIKSWKNINPDLFMTGIQTHEGTPILSPEDLEQYHNNGKIDFLGELGLQYYGIKPDEEHMQAYYKIAEDNGIPVCLHTGLGPPGGPHSFAPKFRTTLGKPTLFESVLVKYPKLKAFIAHAGYPYISETIAMLYIYENLYADIGVLCWALPKEAFHSYLRQLIDAGFGNRIMFGTDQMLWPDAISIAVNTLNEVPFLTEEQKRDILYNNAARFLELDDQTIKTHHE